MKNSTLILSIVLCFLISFQGLRAQAQTELKDLNTKEKTEKQNIEIVKRVFNELNSTKSVDFMDNLYDAEYKFYSPSNSRNPKSLEQSKNSYLRLFKAFPDITFNIKNILADGDYVIVRSVMKGTHSKDEYWDVPANGNKFEAGEIMIYKFQNDKIFEERYQFDFMDFKEQLKNEVPDGWWKVGNSKDSYSVGIDREISSYGSKSAFIVSLDEEIDGFSGLMQISDATPFKGKKIKMTGYAKSENIEVMAGFWLRIDGEQKAEGEMPQMLGFDNMSDRPIKGTTDWVKYEIEMEVPAESVELAYGGLLNGKGKIWFDNISFEEVTGDESKPVNYITEGSINTSFED